MILALSHEISAGMVTYPGLGAPELRAVITREDSEARLASGVSFEIEALTLDPARFAGRAVLVHTGWAQRWGTPGYTELDCPHLSAAAAAALTDAGAAVVGIDSLNIDNPTDPERPGHFGLLKAGIPIIEHLTNLEAVPDDGARLTALPAPVREMASFPVRAVAVWAA